MAIVFTLISMLLTSGADLFEKKAVNSTTEEVLKTVIWYGIFNVLLALLVLFFGMDEEAFIPQELILKNPMTLLPAVLNYSCQLFALLAYKYVGVSVRNTFINTDGLFFIILLIIYYLLTNNATYVTRLFSPQAIIGLVLIIGASFIYPRIKNHENKLSAKDHSPSLQVPKNILILGIIISFIAAFFDGAESMVSSVLIGDAIVNSSIYIVITGFIQFVLSFAIWIYLWIKNKKPYNPFKRTEKYRFISQFCLLTSDMFYVFALSKDALLGIILWSVFPILDIIGARIFMKERLTKLQYLVLFMMITGATFISLS